MSTVCDLPLAVQCQIYDLRKDQRLSFDEIAKLVGCTPLHAARYGGRADSHKPRPDQKPVRSKTRPPKPTPNPDLVTVQEAAASLRVTEATVRAWISAGKVPAVRAGHRLRIQRADLDRFVTITG